MTAYGTEFFSKNDVNRLRILQDVIDRLTTRLAATRLEISDRHCRRLLERYREHGPLSLVNRRRGQPGNRQLIPGLAERALRIIRECYADFGPTLACEKLAEVHGQYLAKETVRKLMYGSPASYGRLVCINHDRVGPAPENSSRLMAVSIAGSRIVVRPARCSFTLMMRPAG